MPGSGDIGASGVHNASAEPSEADCASNVATRAPCEDPIALQSTAQSPCAPWKRDAAHESTLSCKTLGYLRNTSGRGADDVNCGLSGEGTDQQEALQRLQIALFGALSQIRIGDMSTGTF